MKKKIIALALTVFLALGAFAACAKDKTLSSVAVTDPPDKILYKLDEPFDPAGARLTATYSDNSTKVIEVTKEMCSAVDTSTAGSKEVTVSYTDKEVTKSATMTINVVGAEITGQSIEVIGADKNMITVKFKLTQELALDAWDVAEGSKEEQWAEITALYNDVVTGTAEQASQAAEKIGSDVFAVFYGLNEQDEKILLVKTEGANPVIKNKGWSGWLNTSDVDHWYPNGEDEIYVGATIPADTEFQTSVSSLNSYHNWEEIKQSGVVYCDLVIVQKGRISKVTLSAEL
ncbi:MAG: hypothetical protein HPY94_04210 [Clostridia bacterium]|nr:hypothetical protein [Clostridia bacterium]